MSRKCVNRTCEWHHEGGCRLFPGEWGFLECRHSDEENEPKKTVRKIINRNKKGAK